MDLSSTHETTPLLSSVDTLAGRRNDRQPYEKQVAIYMILASTLFERTAFYSLAGNFAPSLQLSTDGTCSTTFMGAFLFSGVSYLSTLIFAVVSDAKLGRGKTIFVGFILYLIGCTMACILATDSPTSCSPETANNTNILNTDIGANEQRTSWMNVALIIIAIGAGAVKSNLAVFGAEQKKHSALASRYFDQYFIAVNIGIMIATLFTPMMSNSKGINSRSAYLFATSMIFLAAVTFIIGYQFYKHATPFDSVITMCIPVLWNACQTWYQNRRYTQYHFTYSPNSESVMEDSIELNRTPTTFLDHAKVVYHGRYPDRIVDDVKSLRSAFLVFILLIPYWLIYNQLYTTFPTQGEHMERSGSEYSQFWMTLGDPITIIVGTTMFNIFLYKYLDARNRSLTTVRKFIIGMSLASMTMFISGGVEVIRQYYCPGSKVNAVILADANSKLSVYIQLSQSIFMGLSELFATVACFEFAYFAAPRSAQSLFMSLYYCTVGLASFLGTGYTALFAAGEPSVDFTCPSVSKTNSNFYNYFFVLAGIQLVFVIVFVVGQKKFQIIRMNSQ